MYLAALIVLLLSLSPTVVSAQSVVGKTIQASFETTVCEQSGACRTIPRNDNIYVSKEGNVFDYSMNGGGGDVSKLGVRNRDGFRWVAQGNSITIIGKDGGSTTWTVRGDTCSVSGKAGARIVSLQTRVISCRVVEGQAGR